MPKEILKGSAALNPLAEGSAILNECVSVTYGAKGRNVLLYNSNRKNPPKITKDGVTVSKEVILKDNAQDAAAAIVNEAALNTAKNAGDGTTASIIVANELIQKGVEAIKGGVHPVYMKKGFLKAAQDFVENLKSYITTITSEKDLWNIAKISTNGDEGLADLISKAIYSIGSEGSVTIAPSPTYGSFIERSEGLTLPSGYVSYMFINDHSTNRCIMKNTALFIYDNQIYGAAQINKFLEEFQATKDSLGYESLLVIADDFATDFISALATMMNRRMLNCCLVKSPATGAQKDDYLNDLAVLTNGSVISTKNGLREFTRTSSMTVDMKWLGFAKEVIIDPIQTLVVADGTKDNTFVNHLDLLRGRRNTTLDQDEKEFLNHRITNLTSGISRIYVGGKTEIEINEKRDRIEDAVCSAKSALKEGIVPGGAITMYNIALEMEASAELEKMDFQIGKAYAIFIEAIKRPIHKLLENAGKTAEEIKEILEAILMSKNKNIGVNLYTDQIEDLIASGIVDPALVIKQVIENATSVASTLLTTDVIITEMQRPDQVVLHGKLDPKIELKDL